MSKKRKKKTFKQRFIKFLSLLLGAGMLLAVLFFYSIKAGLFGKLPDNELLSNIENAQATVVLDEQGENIGYLYRTYRSDISYAELPEHLVNALVCTEDTRFYEHGGVDYRSLLRVLVRKIGRASCRERV